MLKSITLQNFKSFDARVDVELGPLTLVYGPNSGGKSSLLQAIRLLRQSLGAYRPEQRGLTLDGAEVDLGGFGNVVYANDVSAAMTVGLAFAGFVGHDAPVPGSTPTRRETDLLAIDVTAVEMQRPAGRGNRLQEVRFRHEIAGIAMDALLRSGRIASPRNASPAGAKPRPQTYRHVFELVEGHISLFQYLEAVEASLGGVLGYHAAQGAGLKANEWPPCEPGPGLLTFRANRALYPAVLNMLAHEFASQLERVCYIGPLRPAPERYYDGHGRARRDERAAGEDAIELLYYSRPSLYGALNDWLATLGIPYRVGVKNYGRFGTPDVLVPDLRDWELPVRLGLTDVGFGNSQLLPILIEGLARRDHVILVEQPETHLHPALQARLADFFLETSQRNQWIVETHSEGLIRRVLRRVREGVLDPAAVTVLYVMPPGEAVDGQRVVRMSIDAQGVFERPWPHGFFDERFEAFL